MPKKFSLEIRETHGKKYLKVILGKGIVPDTIANHLQQLDSVHRANVTVQQNGKIDLTIYLSKLYEIEELQQEVEITLDNYFQGSPVDPCFLSETISNISEVAFFQIVEYINILGKNLEAFKALNVKFDEERYRDYFIPFLNAISKNHAAKGEVFNRCGKTDILITDTDGQNVFIAECKLWKGQKYLTDGLDQLVSNYVNWRDEKVALIIFNRDTQGFSNIVETAKDAILTHKLCDSLLKQSGQTNFTFSIKNPTDASKKITLELMLFNFN